MTLFFAVHKPTEVNNVTLCGRYSVGKQVVAEAAPHSLIPSMNIIQGLVVMCCWPIGTAVLTVSHCSPRAAGGSSGRGDSTGADNGQAQLRQAASGWHMSTGCSPSSL